MNTLQHFGLVDKDFISYKSKLCSVACSIDYSQEGIKSPLANRIDELTQSYLNQWQFVITTYRKLKSLFDKLNESNDNSEQENYFSEYDPNSIEKEQEFKDYTFLLLTSMKTFMDLFACLTDIALTQEIVDEDKLTDFYRFGRNNRKDIGMELYEKFEILRDKSKYPWIHLLKEVRNRIIHRGYQLKPKFNFQKSNELNVVVYKGTDFYSDIINLKIGELFDNFMNDMTSIEEEISNTLLSSVDKLSEGQKIEVSFKFDGQFCEYSYKEL